MKIIDKDGNTTIAVKEFSFPDGQVHVVPQIQFKHEHVTIKTRIRNGDELLKLLLVNDALRFNGVEKIDLEIAYMLAARMDRRMTSCEPFSLKVVADCLRDKFNRITVLDPHSDVTCALLNARSIPATEYVRQAIKHLGWNSKNLVGIGIPDAGATKRDEDIAIALGGFRTVQCLKYRDPANGQLSGFKVPNETELPREVLLVDDLVDGGGTFAGIAEQLKYKGVEWVGLYATHGIFSKGFEIPNIDHIFTTTSYRPREEYPNSITVLGDDLA